LLPVSKITHQQNTHGSRRTKTKRLPFGALHLPCHTRLRFPELGLFHQERSGPAGACRLAPWPRAASSFNAKPNTHMLVNRYKSAPASFTVKWETCA
jgi:hypothetical protein